MKEWKAELFLLLVTTIWGATFLFTKLGLEYTSPSEYLIFRFTIALILSIIVFGRYFKSINKELMRNGLILGAFFGGGFILQTYGLQLTTISKSAFITGLTVPITPFIYWLVERRPIKLWSKVGVVIASIGLYIFTKPDFDNINLGDLFTIASTFFWALYITYMGKLTQNHNDFKDTAIMVTMQFVIASPIAFLAFLGFEGGDFRSIFNPILIISLLFNGILASFFVTLIHTGFQKYTTPVKAALIFSLEPIFASTFAAVFVNELLNGREYVGAIILFFGVMVSEFGSFVAKKFKMNLN